MRLFIIKVIKFLQPDRLDVIINDILAPVENTGDNSAPNKPEEPGTLRLVQLKPVAKVKSDSTFKASEYHPPVRQVLPFSKKEPGKRQAWAN
ncbi:hypothetical protein [Dongshaea marina]|uniref:hypothetical protein n=1 Tax=Dongshaea marina TaxID=2047966 RepID=UPI000D3E3CF9|nr:hypothetical protein [Dongshaea marina]